MPVKIDLFIVPFNPLSCVALNASYIIILLRLTPDGFTCQRKNTGAQWVNQTICGCDQLTH